MSWVSKSWWQIALELVAKTGSSHASTGLGGDHRKSPTGGLAYGTPYFGYFCTKDKNQTFEGFKAKFGKTTTNNYALYQPQVSFSDFCIFWLFSEVLFAYEIFTLVALTRTPSRTTDFTWADFFARIVFSKTFRLTNWILTILITGDQSTKFTVLFRSKKP